jgi:glycosyltransferase involved in cell wall biosynthesis
MKTAIIHYWLVAMRGGERVLERLCMLYPDADIFTHVYRPEAVSDLIRARKVTTSFIQKLPGATKRYQSYLPLMPLALEQFDLREYDLVLASEAGPAKGVITRPDALSLCYCHSPMRYIWDQYPVYRQQAGALTRLVMPWLSHRLRQWDMASASRVDRFAANSAFVRGRIRKYYGRDAAVIHPPVSVDDFSPAETGDHYLWVSQLVPYKRPDLVVDAFNANGLPLRIVGDGPCAAEMHKRAKGNIQFVERLGYRALRDAYAEARALIFTAEEDFGIVPVEAMAAGRPVIAYGRGGATETVIDGETGLFFHEQSVAALNDAITRFEAWLPRFEPDFARARARHFSPERFDEQIKAFVAQGHDGGRFPS